MRTRAPEYKTIAGMECGRFDIAAKFINLSERQFSRLIRATKKSRTRRNVPMIQLGGPGSTRWFPMEELKAWVAEKI